MDGTPVSLRLLIVEDSEDDAELLVQQLRRSLYAVTCQRVDTAEALRAALTAQTWDVLTSDHAMPRFNAPAAVALAQALCPDLPIIIVSGEISQALAVELLKAGARDYIRKENLDQLPHVVARELREAETRRERQQAEAALCEANQFHQELLASIGEGLAVVDRQYHFVVWNRFMEQLTGLAAEAVLGRQALELFPQMAAELTEDVYQRVFAGETFTVPDRLFAAPGRRGAWISVTYQPHRNVGGQIVGVISTVTDITARKEAELQAQQLKEFNESLIQNATEGIVVQDAAGRFTFVNPAASRLLGRPAAALLGAPGTTGVPADQLPILAAADARRLAGQSDRYELDVEWPDGTRRSALISAAPRYADGLFAGSLAIFSDLTERRQAEKELRASEGKIRAFIEQAGEGILLIDEAGRLCEWNQAQVRLTGLSRAEVLGQPSWEVQARVSPPEQRTPERLACYRAMVEHMLQTGAVPGPHGLARAVICRPDGERREVLQNVFAIATDKGYQMGVFLLDITEQRRVAQQLQESEERYRRIVEGAPWGIHVYQLEAEGGLRLISANQAAQTIPGLDHAGSPVGQSFDVAFPLLADTDLLAHYRRAAAEGVPWHSEHVRYADGRVSGAFEVRAFQTAPGQVAAAFADITARKQAEELLQQQTEKLWDQNEALRQAEQLLRESEEKYRTFVEQSTDGMALADEQGRVVEWNPALERLTGLARAEVVGQLFWDLMFATSLPQARTPERLERLQALTLEALQTGQSPLLDRPFDVVIELASGEQRHIQQTIFLVQAAAGRRLGCVTRDITERRQAEAALQASEAKYRALVEATATGYVILDGAGCVLDANPEYVRLTGRPALADILGRPVTDWTAAHDLARNAAEVQRCLARGYVHSLEIDYVHPGGQVVPIEIDATVLSVAEGTRIITLCRDISDRRQAEGAAHLHAERYRRLVETSPDGIGQIDLTGRLEVANPQLAAMLGVATPGDLLGRNFFDFFTPEERARVLARRDEFVAQATTRNTAYRMQRADGTEFWGEMRGALVRAPDGRPQAMLGILRDITERRQADAALEDANLHLEEEMRDREAAEAEVRQLNQVLEERVRERTAQLAATNRELELFAASASHDLRAPLRVIRGFIGALRADYAAGLGAEARHHLDVIERNALQMERLVGDLLAFARLSGVALARQTVDPARLAHEALDDLSPQTAGRRVAVRIGALPEAQADPALLKQVFVNLLGNALKYTRAHATAAIEVGWRTDQGETVYFVRDDGVGFDMQLADRLFTPFQRLHTAEEFEGNGIGLANVQRVIHRHGGRVWAEAAVGQGATFYFTLGRS